MQIQKNVSAIKKSLKLFAKKEQKINNNVLLWSAQQTNDRQKVPNLEEVVLVRVSHESVQRYPDRKYKQIHKLN
jgi:hypothetical protein